MVLDRAQGANWFWDIRQKAVIGIGRPFYLQENGFQKSHDGLKMTFGTMFEA